MKTLGFIFALSLVVFGGVVAYNLMVLNPRVADELRNDPGGERAARVMMLTFPDGKEIPVNYLREGDTVYVGADGPWWREFEDEGRQVSMFIQGEQLSGLATVELENQVFIDDVFSRLRPAAPAWLPDWANGKLVVIRLQDAGS